MIPLFSIDTNKNILLRINHAVQKTIQQKAFILGPEVTKFEKNFSTLCGSTYCIGVGNGTDALTIALSALHITRGDEVILPAFTFTSTLLSVLHTGATPIFTDISPETYTISPEEISKRITKRTKAIIVVHIYGMPCDMDKIYKITKRARIPIIEDAAQAHGSFYRNRPAGSLGTLGCFSFYPSKNLGAYGDAGAIATSSRSLSKRCLLLRNIGQKTKNYPEVIGFNSRLDSLQAAILTVKLPQLLSENIARRKHADWYIEHLASLPIQFQKTPTGATPNYHIFSIRTQKRNALAKFLKQKGVQTGIHYPTPLHLQKPFRFLGYKKGDFPESEALACTTLSIPIFPSLTLAQKKYIVSSIRSFFTHETA